MAEGRRRRRPAEEMGMEEGSESRSGEERERRSRIGQETDETTRRLIRQQYRQLISNCQQNRDLMLSNRGDKLTEALEDANKLFVGVSEPREAALDAQFLVLATNLGKEKANQLQSDMAEFDSIAFAEDLLTYMDINRLEREDSDSDEDQSTSGFLPNNAWYKLGKEAKKYFRRAPTFHFMLGTFTPDPPVEKPRIERQRKKAGSQEERAMPAQLEKMEESHQEATLKEVERILGLLHAFHQEDSITPISYFEFVTNPNSFARTVENMFHVSFLIRDGLAGVRLDGDKLPIIELLTPQREENDQDNPLRRQAVISIGYEEWQKIVETFEISAPMIPSPPETQSDAEQS